ncbi:MAG TPA: nicotinate-nucleotide adenylyltransferase [Anaerolineae bacterium]|nr:nicotinate-nucleotide adenylyltransferase [Anaerolineae bacterium]HPD40626.1 nicotinate-nucleotide adenylyltransferase [Anaerolineae bacterium]HRT31525.1 nicotinate-nucleotide adenylyltransferase [Anaerolineae bacterium]HRU94194.1 nicotinate-nucleotide adenylyltransferase [Anaerolineae bacterium]HXK42302.1 nicotinate-nucleotide adenylyltransferase [Anaerolineae bacterium]
MSSRPVRFGVFGGSFDPPHYGHLALAETARVQLQLARVLFVPAGEPPHKTDVKLSPIAKRVALVQAAIADNGAFALSRVDVARPGPHYTVDMLRLLRAEFPQVTDWFLLLGEDSLHDFLSWRAPEEILDLAELAVMRRPEKPAPLEMLQERLPTLERRLTWLDVPPLHLSATELRRRVREGLPLRYLVPLPVEVLIRKHQLYTG